MAKCPVHNKEFREGKFGPYCATKLKDDTWCEEGRNFSEDGGERPTKATAKEDKLDRVIALLEALLLEVQGRRAAATQPAAQPAYQARLPQDDINPADIPF